ncbi:alpha/beta fold hydrolase [Enterococcus sp. AZ196]|uniref:alpha/beta fold hydrolase n=1 Tax=Enterococcus sp. AZ196 TaxID=2774659 RepID=UPI003D2E76D1
MPEIFDHQGKPVQHMRARVNGLRMHYVIAGEGEPLLLLHGTPKTHYYWYKMFPLLTENFTVIAPDLRGFGDTDKPTAEEGYDSETNAKDMETLMTQLGYDQFHLHGEDRGAEFAYALAARNPERVKTLSFCEMLLSGGLLEEMSYFKPENIRLQYDQQGVWQWHIPFFWIAHVPEMLITGREREFWADWMKKETWNPNAIDETCIDEWISHIKAPGGLRGVLETYRATFKNGQINDELSKTKLKMPVMSIGAPEFFGPMVAEQMREVAENVVKSEVFEKCGHSLALEAPERLADALIDFISGNS